MLRSQMLGVPSLGRYTPRNTLMAICLSVSAGRSGSTLSHIHRDLSMQTVTPPPSIVVPNTMYTVNQFCDTSVP